MNGDILVRLTDREVTSLRLLRDQLSEAAARGVYFVHHDDGVVEERPSNAGRIHVRTSEAGQEAQYALEAVEHILKQV